MIFKKKDKPPVLIDTFTKKLMFELVRITELEVFLCFIMPFFGITPPETLAGILVVQILGVFIAYSIKSYKESKSEEEIKLIRDGYDFPTVPYSPKKTNNIFKSFTSNKSTDNTDTQVACAPDTAEEVVGEEWTNAPPEEEKVDSTINIDKSEISDIISDATDAIKPLINNATLPGSIFKGLNKVIKK